jgi:hypothetical protein
VTPIGGTGTNAIIGIVSWFSSDGIDPLHRATVKIYNSAGNLVDFTLTDANGYYQFINLADDATGYTVTACGNLDGERYGIRTGVVIPNALPVANIFTNLGPCP